MLKAYLSDVVEFVAVTLFVGMVLIWAQIITDRRMQENIICPPLGLGADKSGPCVDHNPRVFSKRS